MHPGRWSERVLTVDRPAQLSDGEEDVELAAGAFVTSDALHADGYLKKKDLRKLADVGRTDHPGPQFSAAVDAAELSDAAVEAYELDEDEDDVAEVTQAQAAVSKGHGMIALRVPLDVARAIALDGGEPPEDLHVTLAFYPRAADMGAAEVQRIMGAALGKANCSAPIQGVLNGVLRFSGVDGRDCVCYAVDSAALSTFRQELVNMLAANGVPPAMDHGFTPHVTVLKIDAVEDMPAQRCPVTPIVFREMVFHDGEEEHVFSLVGPPPIGLVYGLAVPVNAGDRRIKLSGAVAGHVVSEIPLAIEGEWDHPDFGKLTFNDEVFDEMIGHFQARLIPNDLPLDIEHGPPLGPPGAAAWFVPDRMFKKKDEKGRLGLWAAVDWTRLGIEAVKSKEYKYTSITFCPKWTNPETGQKHTNVVMGAAITVDPFLKGMPTLQENFPALLSGRAGRPLLLAEFQPAELSKGVAMKTGEKDDTAEMDDEAAGGDDGDAELSTKKADGDSGEDNEAELSGMVDQLSELAGKINAKGGKLSDAHCKKLADAHGGFQKFLEKRKKADEDEEEGGKAKMSSHVSDNDPKIVAMSRAIDELNASNKRKDAELARLSAKAEKAEREQREQTIKAKLSKLFPSSASEEVRLTSTQRTDVEALACDLAELDQQVAAKSVKLSSRVEGQEAAGNFSDRLLKVLEAVPAVRLNRRENGVGVGAIEESEDDVRLTNSDRRLQLAQRHAEEKGIPLYKAMEELEVKANNRNGNGRAHG
jgi:2'-5' RNA ligase